MSTGRSATVRGLLRACHPEPTAAVTAIAGALSLAAGARTRWVAPAFLSGQLVTGWSNDWLDRSRDAASGRRDKPLATGQLSPSATAKAALAAGAACVPLSLAMGRRPGAWHLVAVTSALAYDAGLKATPLSFAPYALSFGLVPSIVTLGAAPPRWARWQVSTAAALLGVGAHLANALPDLDDDLLTGVRGLPHRLGAARCGGMASVLLVGATGLLALGSGRVGAVAVTGAVTLSGLGLARAHARPTSEAAFLAAIAVAGLDVALLLARGTRLR